jgi:hypothetical protein
MRKTTDLDHDQFRFRNLPLHILIGTASDWYAGWIGQIYSGRRQETLSGA